MQRARQSKYKFCRLGDAVRFRNGLAILNDGFHPCMKCLAAVRDGQFDSFNTPARTGGV
jgi:hypothetical protein